MRASQRAYESLREEIIDGSLAPGTVLQEVELATRLGISRTPVREALARLTSESLLSPLGARGVVVPHMSLPQVRDLFAYREALESSAVALAARATPAARERFSQLTTDFDRADVKNATAYYALSAQLDHAIAQTANNSYLTRALTQLRPHLQRVRRIARDDMPRLEESAREHAAIARAIADGKPELAQAALTLHLAASLNNIENTYPEGE